MHIPDTKEILDFVRESNAIEGIFEDNSHPLVMGHISAIEYAIAKLKKGKLPTYSDVHRILLDSEQGKTPGLYRSVLVRVGGYIAPPPAAIVELMADYWNTVLCGPKEEDEDIEQWIWDMHFEFESIHPFIDGNGRVGRIGMNALRLRHGLPWITIRAEDRWGYYQRIMDYRK